MLGFCWSSASLSEVFWEGVKNFLNLSWVESELNGGLGVGSGTSLSWFSLFVEEKNFLNFSVGSNLGSSSSIVVSSRCSDGFSVIVRRFGWIRGS